MPGSCGAIYIEKTGRSIKTRLTKHQCFLNELVWTKHMHNIPHQILLDNTSLLSWVMFYICYDVLYLLGGLFLLLVFIIFVLAVIISKSNASPSWITNYLFKSCWRASELSEITAVLPAYHRLLIQTPFIFMQFFYLNSYFHNCFFYLILFCVNFQ